MRKRVEQSTCAGCGAVMSREQLICPECGMAGEPERLTRCRHCGTLNRHDRRTCLACEMPLGLQWMRMAGSAAAIVLVAALLFAAGPWLRGRLAPAATPVGVQAGETTPEITATAVALAPASPSSAPTRAPTVTPTRTPTAPPTATPPPTPTGTPSPTATASSTPTVTPSRTATASTTPSTTPSRTATASPTSSATPSRTPSATPSHTPTTTATPTPQGAAASPTPFVYVVKQGDNLYDIAQRFGVTVAAIKQANGLTSNNLWVGQELIIPLPTPTPTPTPTPEGSSGQRQIPA